MMRGAIFLFLPVLLLSGACLGDDDGSSGRASERLVSCGFVTEGHLPTPPLYLPNDCYERCYGAATCEQLAAAVCGEDIELLRHCDRRCAYHCASGALIDPVQVCDGINDCLDPMTMEMNAIGDDEADCEEIFTCRDGSMRFGIAGKCNGVWQCLDGSDEQGCTSVQPMCNRWSTDAKCPQFECDSGGKVPLAYRCDGGSQNCLDNSDERGCAQVTLMCEPPM